MYNLLYYSKNFRKTTGSIYPTKDSESFNYKTKLIGNVPGVADLTHADDIERELEDIKIVVPLKDISNFMFNLDFSLINSEIELILK